MSDICGARRLGQATGYVFVCQLPKSHGGIHHDTREAHPGTLKWSLGTEAHDEAEVQREVGRLTGVNRSHQPGSGSPANG